MGGSGDSVASVIKPGFKETAGVVGPMVESGTGAWSAWRGAFLLCLILNIHVMALNDYLTLAGGCLVLGSVVGLMHALYAARQESAKGQLITQLNGISKSSSVPVLQNWRIGGWMSWVNTANGGVGTSCVKRWSISRLRNVNWKYNCGSSMPSVSMPTPCSIRLRMRCW
ncbi:MAG: hypothetical protein HC898_03285 [Phycisphaerales bacterium]|nr:hypothetical protein [Phycisphaerales bacterium]